VNYNGRAFRILTSTNEDHYQTDPNEVYEWVLNRETASLLIPKYYGEALQVQYMTDPYSSQMVQIIHDNIRESFIPAYNHRTGAIMMTAFSNAVGNKRTFSVMYNARSRKQLQNKFDDMMKTFRKSNDVI
jgi:hypothetical protein